MQLKDEKVPENKLRSLEFILLTVNILISTSAAIFLGIQQYNKLDFSQNKLESVAKYGVFISVLLVSLSITFAICVFTISLAKITKQLKQIVSLSRNSLQQNFFMMRMHVLVGLMQASSFCITNVFYVMDIFEKGVWKESFLWSQIACYIISLSNCIIILLISIK